PALRGTAAYRAEDFAAAQEAWAAGSGADALYNQGNALAKSGQYEAAISAYQHALDIDPHLDDAQANKRAVEDWLKRQQSAQDRNRQESDKRKSAEQDNKEQQAGQQADNPQQGEGNPSTAKDQQAGQPPDQTDAQQGDSQKDEPDASKQEQGEQPKNANPQTGDEKKNPPDVGKGEAEAAKDKQQKEAQQKQFGSAIDQALDQQKSGEKPEAALASPQDEATREQQQAMQQWLQRIPDDPGGLLRQKFQLEYDRRQRGEGGG
ncbi:MAG: tetratricopeptide repeat protein, partial [Dokdonella sp.]